MTHAANKITLGNLFENCCLTLAVGHHLSNAANLCCFISMIKVHETVVKFAAAFLCSC